MVAWPKLAERLDSRERWRLARVRVYTRLVRWGVRRLEALGCTVSMDRKDNDP
jgi:hypothetical protein